MSKSSWFKTREGLVPLLAGLIVAIMSWSIGQRRDSVPVGGDVPGYLLAARYNPFLDNFDNPSHGWGYPFLIKTLTPAGGDLDQTGRVMSALGMGMVAFAMSAMAYLNLPRGLALWSTALFVTRPDVNSLGSVAMSDAVFFGIFYWTLYNLFLRDRLPSLVGFLLLGALVTFSMFIRGNGIILLVAFLAGLFLQEGRWTKRSTFFLAGGLGLILLVNLFALVNNIPLRSVFRSGAGELAFASLDRTGTWLHRADYETLYPTYGQLIRSHFIDLLQTGSKTIYHLYDWWLIPAMLLSAYFIAPGFIRWLRHLTPNRVAITFVLLTLQATFLWSGRFQESRHIMGVIPWLILLAFEGMLLLPHWIYWPHYQKFRFPIRGFTIAIVTTLMLGLQGKELSLEVRPATGSGRDQQAAGQWLGSVLQPGDKLAATRLNMAYYGGPCPSILGRSLEMRHHPPLRLSNG